MNNRITLLVTLVSVILITGNSGCLDKEEPVNYQYGTFPDSIINLESINSEFDDFNMDLPQISASLPYIFSSNRSSSGGDFNLESASIHFSFLQQSGEFQIDGEMFSGDFYNSIMNAVNDDYDQFGPYRFLNSKNGMEYFFVTSGNEDGSLDIEFMEYTPPSSGGYTFIPDPQSATVLNSLADDAYISIDWDIDNFYLTSDRGGNFDIYTIEIDHSLGFKAWLTGPQEVLVLADSVNSDFNDKCPYIFKNYMIFTSDRPGGLGGFDLYYSEFKDGKWNSPVNFGPRVNTQYNEYRPVIGLAHGFTNYFMIFSSDRPDGVGGYDLYFTGVAFEED